MIDWPWNNVVRDVKGRMDKNDSSMDELYEKVGSLEDRVESLLKALNDMDRNLRECEESKYGLDNRATNLLVSIESRLTDLEFFSGPTQGMVSKIRDFILKNQILLLSCLCCGAAAAGMVWLILDKM